MKATKINLRVARLACALVSLGAAVQAGPKNLVLVPDGPLAFWVMNNWLQHFAYRIELNWSLLLFAGLAAVTIALLAISWQSIRAALGNPVNALRS